MRVALIGPRGAGKSTVAALLADQMELPLVSTDAEITRRAGRTIAQIVAADGWPAFRRMEAEAIADILDGGPTDAILDCGGGIVLLEENRRRLRDQVDAVVYLHAAPEALAARMPREDEGRPRLTDAESQEDEIRRVLAERDALYRECARRVLDVTALGAEDAAAEVLKMIAEDSGEGAERT